jgi:4'-phosphopantetheinyl transferase
LPATVEKSVARLRHGQRRGLVRLIPCRAVPSDGNIGATLGSFLDHSRIVRSVRVAAETLDLWLLDADVDVEEGGVDLSALDDGERRRAEALETPDLQHRYLLAHAATRHLLGQALGLPPRDVRIAREACPRCGAPGGRPVVAEPTGSLHFSVSASKHLVLIGLASAAVGVDVEAVPSLRAVSEATELLHPAEREELLSMAPEVRLPTFARLWSRKEAYLKGIGVGLAHGHGGEYLGSRPGAANPEGWTLLDVPVPPGFAASAALRTGSHTAGRSDRPGRRAS